MCPFSTGWSAETQAHKKRWFRRVASPLPTYWGGGLLLTGKREATRGGVQKTLGLEGAVAGTEGKIYDDWTMPRMFELSASRQRYCDSPALPGSRKNVLQDFTLRQVMETIKAKQGR